MAIQNVELVSGSTYKITKTEEVSREVLLAVRNNKVSEQAAHQQRVNALTEEIAALDEILNALPEEEVVDEGTTE